MSSGQRREPFRVGVIGAGEVSQVVHLPTLTLLQHLFEVVAICDVSQEAVEHSQRKFHIPQVYASAAEMVKQANIEVVIVASADEYHCEHVVQAADAGKHVLVEKPMTLTRSDAERIEEARVRNKVHIFVAYMRRYTPVFAVFLDELARAGRVDFARVFDYPGENAIFVGQSSTAPKVFVKDVPQAAQEDKKQRARQIVHDALGEQRANDARLVKAFRILGSLGSHDLSCMRHVFGGVPDACTTSFISPSAEFIGATFLYNKQPAFVDDEAERSTPFQVSYETGWHPVGTFDAFIEVYCRRAIVTLKYDTPFVKGLPIFVTVRANCGEDGAGYEERKIRPTYVDAYSAEFIRLYEALQAPVVQEPSREVLTYKDWAASYEMCGPGDAVKDLDIFDMILSSLR